ncbi:MAG: thioredoxin family protein [Myxococcota bacterium]
MTPQEVGSIPPPPRFHLRGPRAFRAALALVAGCGGLTPVAVSPSAADPPPAVVRIQPLVRAQVGSSRPRPDCTVPSGALPAVQDGRISWLPFESRRALARLLDHKRPVFLNFTADWCIDCLVNERQYIETARVRRALVENRVLPMKVDFTQENSEIERWLEEIGRSGIPVYAVLYPGGEMDLLPETISASQLVDAFEKAAGRFPPEPLPCDP